MYDDFETIIGEISTERKRDEYWYCNSMEFKARSVMANFRVWCWGNGKDINDESLFKKYITNLNLDFWLKKHIAENYWSYAYTYDHDKKKFSAVKNN